MRALVHNAILLGVAALSAPTMAANPEAPEFALRLGDVYRLEWSSEQSQKFSGAAAMTFYDEEHWEYRIEIVAEENGRFLLDVSLTRHWGDHEDTLGGRASFDSASPEAADGSTLWRPSEEVGKTARLSLARESLELTPVDPESTAATEALRVLRCPFYSGEPFTVVEEMTAGAVEIECVPTTQKSTKRATIYKCEAGDTRETTSKFKTSNFIAEQITRLAGPGRLKTATLDGVFTYPTKQDSPSTTKLETRIVQVFGQGTSQEIKWGFTGYDTGILRRQVTERR